MKTKEGLWKFSPSGLYGYEDCKACFWVEQHIGRHPSIPMRLNTAVDEKLKYRYDEFRKKSAMPPELSELSEMKLFPNLELLDSWRSNKTALQVINERDGYTFEGMLDEVLINQKEEVVPADFKSSGDVPKEDKQKYYKLQLHAYALMLREHGWKPAKKAYLIHYFTKDRTNSSLNMEFNYHLDEVALDLPTFEETMRSMVKLLDGTYPGEREYCTKCAWNIRRKKLLGDKIIIKPTKTPLKLF